MKKKTGVKIMLMEIDCSGFYEIKAVEGDENFNDDPEASWTFVVETDLTIEQARKLKKWSDIILHNLAHQVNQHKKPIKLSEMVE